MEISDLPSIPINPTVLQLCLAVLLVALVYGAGRVVTFILGRFSERFPARRLFFKRLQTLPQISTYIISAYLIIEILSPEQVSFYAILGSIALALALAAQDLLKDIIGGIIVLVDKPYQIGDRIRLQEGVDGEVIHIGLRSTKLMTSGTLITIPNSKILTENVSNTNASAIYCPVVAHIYLPGPVDLATVEHIARDAVLTAKTVYLKKPITIDMTDEFPDSSITHLEIRAYVFDSRYERTLPTDITRRVKKALFEKGIITADPPLAVLKDRGMAIEELDKRVHLALAENLMALGVRFAHRNHEN